MIWVATNKRVGKGKTQCFEPHWEGPYTVYRRLPNDVTYDVHLPNQLSKKRKVHVFQLKKYIFADQIIDPETRKRRRSAQAAKASGQLASGLQTGEPSLQSPVSNLTNGLSVNSQLSYSFPLSGNSGGELIDSVRPADANVSSTGMLSGGFAEVVARKSEFSQTDLSGAIDLLK